MTPAQGASHAAFTSYFSTEPRILCAAPAARLGLADALRQLAASAWAEIAVGDQVDVRVGEESLTDYLLMRLAAAVPGRVAVQKYRRHEEAQHGADYEFLLGSRRRFVRLRIQAKRVDLSVRAVPEYRYRELWKSRNNATGHPTYQIDALIQAARAVRPVAFPVYAFYNAWNVRRIGAADSRCRRVLPLVDLLGWTLAPAEVIRVLPHTAGGTELRAVNQWAHSIACEIGAVDEARGATPLADAVQERINSVLGAFEAAMRRGVVPGADAGADRPGDLRRVAVHEGLDELPPHLERLFAADRPGDRGSADGIVESELAGPPEDDPALGYSVLIRDDRLGG